VSALNKMLGFEVLNENETIDEATARLEGMQPIDSAVVVKVNEIESKVAAIDDVKAQLTQVTTAQKDDSEALLAIMSDLKSEISEIKSKMTPQPVSQSPDVTIPNVTPVSDLKMISLGKGRFSKN